MRTFWKNLLIDDIKKVAGMFFSKADLADIVSDQSKKLIIKWYEPQSKLWTQKTVQAPRN